MQIYRMAASSAGYSGVALVRKLGIREQMTVVALGAPKNYAGLVDPLPAGARITRRLPATPAFVHVFTTSSADLAARLHQLRGKIAPDGVVWVSWPKKVSKIATDVTEQRIRDVALPLGFVDVKVCAVDETWSGLKLVIRRELRAP